MASAAEPTTRYLRVKQGLIVSLVEAHSGERHYSACVRKLLVEQFPTVVFFPPKEFILFGKRKKDLRKVRGNCL